ncbi:MAG TPA: outer membrane beta-barrel protein [Candidatus Dormibacteraeota bacterium]|nr:outer membrane beta-barrel protein [Candidatus Dormibacteraeota bacterium]
MRKLAFFAVIFAVFAFVSLATAQQGDAYIGGGTLLSSSASSGTTVFGSNCTTSSNGGTLCPEKGGTYLNLGADVIFKKRIGAAFDVNWKASQASVFGPGGQPYRPLVFTFNGVFQPRLSKKVGVDLFGGIGWQSTRLYAFQSTTSCVYFGACYTSANHFLVDVGGGIRYYVWGHMFVRPEVRVYHILNNTDTSGITGFGFTSNNIIRVGASIGYTIGPD